MIYTLLFSLILAQSNKPLVPAKAVLNKSLEKVYAPPLSRGTTEIEIECAVADSPTTVIVPVVNFANEDFHLVLRSTSLRIFPSFPKRTKRGYLVTAKPWTVNVYAFQFKSTNVIPRAMEKVNSNQRVRIGIIEIESNDFQSRLVKCELFVKKRSPIEMYARNYGQLMRLAIFQMAADLRATVESGVRNWRH